MTNWQQFTDAAPHISSIFARRHQAAGRLCMLGTQRADGYPRISPLEPTIIDAELWLAGMSDARKFQDLVRDPRLCLHTATVDTQVSDGDAKLWGIAHEVTDPAARRRFVEALFEQTGFDLREHEFTAGDHLFTVQITGASALEVDGDHLNITIWHPGEPERVVRKH
jgi:hypothetical protein